MECVGAIEAKDRFTELVGKVEHGETITITRDGVPVAVLAPPPAERSEKPRKTVQEAIDSLRELRRGLRLDGLSVREMRDEGRP